MKYRKVYIRLIITYLAIFLLPLVINIVMLENLPGKYLRQRAFQHGPYHGYAGQ